MTDEEFVKEIFVIILCFLLVGYSEKIVPGLFRIFRKVKVRFDKKSR